MQVTEYQDLWEKTLEHIVSEVGFSTYKQWFEGISFELDGNVLKLTVASDLCKQFLRANYMTTLEEAFRATGLDLSQFNIVIEAPSPNEVSLDIHAVREQSLQTHQNISEQFNHNLNKNYSFENFVIGESNHFAYTNAQNIASEQSGTGASLFIYGKSGLGKTHLMHAIGNQYLRTNPTAKVLAVTCNQFVESLIESIAQKTQNAFKEPYKNADLLLVDDIQMLANKESIQVEMFYIFNTLHDRGRKIVFTSDRPPKELSNLMERLSSRLAWGLTVDIQTPELETRVAILRKKAEREQFILPNDVAMFIAESVESNVRELEGALSRLVAYARPKTTTSLPLAKDILSPILRNAVTHKKLDAELIMEVVRAHFDISLAELTGASRMRKIAVPRQIAQYLIREYTALPFPKIADKFGGRDHTTVMHACRKIANEMEADENFKNTVHSIINKAHDRGI